MNVSIIICTYNRASDLDNVLAQLSEQIVSTQFKGEVLIVDNNSKDDTKEIVKKYVQTSPNFRYILETRQGKPHALNAAIKEAKGEWLIFSDDDIILNDDWLASVLTTITNTKFKCFFGKIISRWLVDEPVWFDPRMRSVIVNADHGDQIKFPMNYLVGANMGIHREVFNECGVFDETRKRYEDAEISLRIRKKFDIVYVPDVVIYHPVTADRMTKKYFRNWYYEMGCFEKFVIDLKDKPILKIPRWIYRQGLTHLWKMMTSGKESERFYNELHLHRFKGFIQTIWGSK